MARKCGNCGNLGHNRRTCPTKKASNEVANRYKRPNDTDCPYDMGQRVAVHFPWQPKAIVGVIDSIDYSKRGVWLHDEKSGKNHGFTWDTLDEWKIRVEVLAHGQKVKRRRKKRPNPEEE